jgi:hypothetical protein
MGPSQSGQTPGASAQQLYRQVQIMVNEALRTLDTARAPDQASQAEVESLRAAIWSDLTALEAEFGREDGPRADRLERFFTHLLSSGDHVGQIETLGGVLVGGAPPSQPLPDSPVAGLHRLHSTLSGIRRQWRDLSPSAVSQPSSGAAASSDWKTPVAESVGAERFEKRPISEASSMPSGRRAPVSRPRPSPTRKGNGSERLLDDLGYSNLNPPAAPSADVDALRPRVLLSFVAVFVVLMLVGVGVIYWGLSSSSADDIGGLPTQVPTIAVGTIPAGTPQTTPTPNPGPPVLQVLGSPVEPCPQGTAQFQISNIGGGVLIWNATVQPQNEVSLDMTSGQLSGGLATSIVTVTVTALVSSGSGTITIITNIQGAGGTYVVQFRIRSCG